jgi:fructose-1,6-bisphosphatase I / sedoheptulose-1,7-bisphosphatase
MRANRTTLGQFLADADGRNPSVAAELQTLVLDLAMACRAIARLLAQGAIDDICGHNGQTNLDGDIQQKLDVAANDIFVRATQAHGTLSGMLSEEMEEPCRIAPDYRKGTYLLVFDPLDGSSNIDVNVPVGSIFSILRAVRPGHDPDPADFFQAGMQQVVAGYALYGPATMLVLSFGAGVHGFTFDPTLGEFLLTHEDIRISSCASEFAINTSNSRFWEPAIRRYVDECLAGKIGVREKDFNMRWVGSLVVETHRILMRGGVFLYPRDSRDKTRNGRLRLLYEASPIAMLIEQASGRASTGRERILDLLPTSLHQRVPLIFGASEEVERIERYCRDPDEAYDAPLFGVRGLFRTVN